MREGLDSLIWSFIGRSGICIRGGIVLSEELNEERERALASAKEEEVDSPFSPLGFFIFFGY